MQFWAIVVDGFRQSRDRKIFWVMLAITLLVAGAMACIGFSPGRISFLFGFWEIQDDRFTILSGLREDLIATILVDYIMALILGWIGITLAIIATAGFLPAFLERGSVDVVLSKPMPRWRLFLAKYAGAMVFVLVQATVFVVLTFLVAGFRWGVWITGYLLCIPLVVLLFSYLYCISACVAVRFRSTVVSVIVTIGAWLVFSSVQTMGDMFEMYPSWQQNRTAYAAVRAARWIVPKTEDVVYLAKAWTGARPATEVMPEFEDEHEREVVDRAAKIEIERMNINPVLTIGSSLLFEGVVLLFAIWTFSRRDY